MLPTIAVLARTDEIYRNPIGTATVASPDLLLTCAHVLREGGYSRASGTEVRLRVQDRPEPLVAFLIDAPWIDRDTVGWPPDEKLPPKVDIVALKLKNKLGGESPVLRALGLSDGGAEVSSFGFPASQPSGREAYGRVASRSDMRGLRQLEAVPQRFPIETGFSGGPVFDKDQATVGVVVLRWRPGQDDLGAPPAAFMIPLSSISALFQEHKISGLRVDPPILLKYRKARDLIKWVDDRLEENPYGVLRSTPRLHLSLAIPKNDHAPADAFSKMEQLHIGDDTEFEALFDLLEPREILSPNDSRNYYIQAPGGAGKTFFQYELLTEGPTAGVLPFFVNAMSAGTAIANVFQKSTTEEKLRTLFELSKCKVGFPFFRNAIDAGDPVLLVIDGLNEVSAEVSQVTGLISSIVTDYDKIQIVMADRLTFRGEYPDSFVLATISPLKPELVKETLGDAGEFPPDYERLMRIPFFLDLVREKDASQPAAGGALILKYVESLLQSGNHARTVQYQNTVDSPLFRLGQVAFCAYQEGKQEFSHTNLRSAGGPASLELDQLVGAGLLRAGRTSSSYVFRHQLIHDCLAAFYFWNGKLPASPENLGVLTCGRRSSDALGFVLENLDEDKADDFIINVYDWDWGITLSCLVETRTNSKSALAAAICAVIAEKLDDTFLHTRQRPRARLSALRKLLDIDGDTLLVSDIPVHIREREDQFRGERLRRWWLAFTAVTPCLDVWHALIGSDPLAGWSAASALRRIARDEDSVFEQLEVLYHALKSQKEAAQYLSPLRWRIVHVLGRFSRAVQLLMDIGFDNSEDPDVRYGAMRELVEIAAHQSETKAGEILNQVYARLTSASADLHPRALSALRNCAILKGRAEKEPTWWRGLYRPILQSASRLAESFENDYPLWRAQLERFEANERDASD
jgi:hypothetical protein